MPLLTTPAMLRLVAWLALTSTVRGIRFNISTPMQCEPLEVTWEEKQGDGDMRLLIMPAAEFSPQSIILNITIPSSASSPYTIPTFSEPQGLEFVASLIDSSGYSNTGVTEILTVGSPSSSGSASCLSTAPDPDFFFYTDPQAPTTVPQCGNVQVTWQNSYTLPASVVGLIPGGEIWTVHEITGPDQGGGQGAAGSGYGWQVNVREGTRFLMYMPNNGPVGSGGSTPLFTVGAGGSGCISDSSPSSIAPSAPASTISGVGGGGGRPGGGSGSDSAGNNSSGSGSGSNTGAIVGGAVGGVAFVVLALIVLFVFLRRRARQVKDPQHPRTKLMGSYGTSHGSSGGGTGSGAVVGGAALMEDRRRSSVVDLLAGEKPRNGSLSAANGMATAGAIERQDSDETTYEPSPYFSSGANTASPGAVRSSFPRTSDEITSANTNGQNRYSRESGMLAPIDFGTGAGLGMAGMTAGSDRQRRASETTYQPGSEADATLSHSGATVSSRGHPELTHSGGELRVGGDPNVGSTGRSNSTRKRRPLTAQNGDDASVPPPTRFVLHQDAGVVDSAEATRPDEQGLVEMPPRYDQLRSGPPQ